MRPGSPSTIARIPGAGQLAPIRGIGAERQLSERSCLWYFPRTPLRDGDRLPRYRYAPLVTISLWRPSVPDDAARAAIRGDHELGESGWGVRDCASRCVGSAWCRAQSSRAELSERFGASLGTKRSVRSWPAAEYFVGVKWFTVNGRLTCEMDPLRRTSGAGF
jgi:hypothetical protein